MSKDTGHKRVAIMVGAGYIPGINAVVAGASLAAGKLGWELLGIRDGFEGILHPEKYPEGGLFAIDPKKLNLDPNTTVYLASRPGSIHLMSEPSTRMKWWKKWICRMSC